MFEFSKEDLDRLEEELYSQCIKEKMNGNELRSQINNDVDTGLKDLLIYLINAVAPRLDLIR